MSEPQCLDCLLKKSNRMEQKIEGYAIQCPTCKHAIKKQKCMDGCGKDVVFCDFFGYWHTVMPMKCFGYSKKKVKK